MDTIFEKDPFAVLGIQSGAGREQIKAAYRRRAREEHPDLFPAAQRRRQQLRMMEVNEAYMQLLARDEIDAPRTPGAAAGSPGVRATAAEDGLEPGRRSRPPFAGIRAEKGGRRDPAYELYHQGYEYLGRARALMNPRRNLSEEELRRMKLRTALEALRLSEKAYRCFLNVITGYPDSMWSEGALDQLESIERMNKIYQRMCEGSLAD